MSEPEGRRGDGVVHPEGAPPAPRPTTRTPGAMTTAMRAASPASAGPRYLRWAIVQGGRIVREAIYSPDKALTVGRDGDVPWAALQGARDLLVAEAGTWRLHAPPGAEGRHADGDLGSLLAGARPSSDGWRSAALPRDARLRLRLGDVSLLLQLVDRPPARLRPALPASLQRGLLGGTDWTFSAFVAFSAMLHFGMVTYLSQADYAIERALIPADHEAVVIFTPDDAPDDDDVPEEVMDPDGEPVPDDEASEPVADSTDRTPTDRPSRPSPSPSPSPFVGDADGDQATLDENARIAANLAVQDVLGGISADMGNVIDRLAAGANHADSQEILDGVDGVVPGGVPEAGRIGIRGSRPEMPCAAGHNCLDGLARRPTDIRPREPGPVVERVVRVVPGPMPDFFPEPTPPGWDSRALYRALRARMRAIQSCYEHQITHGDPDLEGRLRLEMEVMPVGTVSRVQVAENTTGSSALAQCAVRAVQRVRVHPGPPEVVRAEFPVVFARNQ